MFVNCKTCGKEFSIKPFDIKYGRGKFCSQDCYHKYNTGENNNKWKGGKVEIKCEQCGLEIKRKPYEVKSGRKLFCSRECASNFRKGKTFRHEKSWVKLICKNCGKEYDKRISVYRERGRQFCSHKCYHEHKAAEFVVITCQWCGKEKLVRKLYVDRGQYKFCSDKCRMEIRLKGIDKGLLVKKCIVCGGEFRIRPQEYESGKRKHCSKKCSRRMVKRICDQCGKEYEMKRSIVGGRYCSNSCYRKSNKETSIERIVREFLESKGVKFESQVKFKGYIVDFVIPYFNLCIYFDGKYWHASERAKKTDAAKDLYLKDKGYQVIRLGEDLVRSGEFKREVDECLKK